jgi:amino acid transporter/phosphohistidine phosphatase SixA
MPPTTPSLRRELGRWDLTAIGVNQVIGGAVFLMPAVVAAQIGAWSWLAVGLVGVLSLLIALNFAEASSRFEGTGGAYLYTRAAFGRFTSFEVGWMLWVTRVTSWASVINGLADALGYYWPGIRVGTARQILITVVVAVLAAINIRGIRQSAWTVNVLTIAKLAPLALFILLGLPHVAFGALRPDVTLTWTQVSAASLTLIFAYGGYEVVPVPAGEARDPRRIVPFAMIMTIVIVAVVMTLAQVVALGTLPSLSTSRTPLADSAALFLGAWGALLLTSGAALSMTGNNMGQALSGSRNLFALAENGDVPAVFGLVHPRFHTPYAAIAFTSVASLILALSGSFASMAAVSAVSRLVVYVGTCASVLALRRTSRAPFTIPLGPVIPGLALLVSLAILYGASPTQRRAGLIALAVGAVLYGIARATTRMTKRPVLPLVLALLVLAPSVAHAQKLVLIVRHAERADQGMQDEVDPTLSAAGQARAEKLAAMLADADIKAIYVTAYRRTQQTAAPLAARIHVKPEPIPSTTPALVARLKSEHANHVVLIVGHSNTIGDIIKALGGPGVAIGDREYDNLFVLVPATGAMTRIRY